MKYIMTDIEADGPAPGTEMYSMVSFAAMEVEPSMSNVFFGEVCPISEKWIPEALKVSGYTREQTLLFPPAEVVLPAFADWLESLRKRENERIMFVSDNIGFDWSFLNYYLWAYAGRNPGGHTSQNLGDLYKGMKMSCFESFKHLRRTRHSHDPRDDVKGNVEAMLAMRGMGLKF